jgi:prepilin-type N-terminal cleavage/methylation domain-containing protein
MSECQPGRRTMRGFTMVELLIVVAIALTVAAVALPSVLNSIYNVRLRAAANEVAGLLQQAHFRAIRDNTYYPVRSATTGGATVFYLDTSTGKNATTWSSTYPTVQLSRNVTSATSGNPDIATMALGVTPALTPPFFSSRGTPCAVPSGTNVCVNAAAPWYQIFLTDTRPTGPNGWASITISPAGRTKVWLWTGNQWQ